MFTHISDDDYKERISATHLGLLLGFKPLCPHCKNMEKVIEKFAATQEGVELLSLDITQGLSAASALGAERAPTLFVIKGGSIVAHKTGLMNPRELAEFFRKA